MSVTEEPARAAAVADQRATPYADADAGTPFVRTDVPAHGGDGVAQPELATRRCHSPRVSA